MSVPTTNISLRQIRADTDLSAAGTINDSYLRQKIQKFSGSLSLTDFRGALAGLMSYIWGTINSIGPKYSTSQDIFNTDVYLVRWKNGGLECIQGQSRTGDSWATGRMIGTVSESGTYRLTGYVDRMDGYSDGIGGVSHFPQITVTAHTSGYLQGNMQIKLNKDLFTSTSDTIYISETFSLDTSYPYVQVALENIMKWYPVPLGPDEPEYTSRFRNFKLVKV